MTRQTCTMCNLRKSLDEFPKDSRYSTGHDTSCRACKNAAKRAKVKCPNCKEMYTSASITIHMKTKKCREGLQEWKHPMPAKKRFSSRGQSMVKCLCGHRTCKVDMKEHNAYRHMKYGLEFLLKPRAPTYRQQNSDSESERDL